MVALSWSRMSRLAPFDADDRVRRRSVAGGIASVAAHPGFGRRGDAMTCAATYGIRPRPSDRGIIVGDTGFIKKGFRSARVRQEATFSCALTSRAYPVHTQLVGCPVGDRGLQPWSSRRWSGLLGSHLSPRVGLTLLRPASRPPLPVEWLERGLRCPKLVCPPRSHDQAFRVLTGEVGCRVRRRTLTG